MPKLPDFLVIGAAKSGTTSLHYHLKKHPGIFLPTRKELNYFVSSGNWRRGPEWYASHFRDARADAKVGEISPKYSMAQWSEGVPKRICESLGRVRLIYMVRDPVERIRSEFLHRVARGRERRSINQAILADSSYIDTCKYWSVLQAYMDFFPLDDIKVVASERLFSTPGDAIAEICRFIGVDSGRMQADFDNINPRTGKTVLPFWMYSVASTGVYKTLSHLLPRSWRKRVRARSSKPVSEVEDSILPEVLAVVQEILIPEARALGESGALPKDHIRRWSLQEQ